MHRSVSADLECSMDARLAARTLSISEMTRRGQPHAAVHTITSIKPYPEVSVSSLPEVLPHSDHVVPAPGAIGA
jgi:hypothetical protein